MDKTNQERIGFLGDIKDIAAAICKDFNLGNVVGHALIAVGYEDFNFLLKTTTGKFFIKIFAASRTLSDCKRNVEIMLKAASGGVRIPKLIKSNQGYFYLLNLEGVQLRMCVMEFIEGKDMFSAKSSLTTGDIQSLARQAVLINALDIKPEPIYDSWAITNFPAEFKKKSKYLHPDDLQLIKPLLTDFKNLNIKTLPHCFAHGDIIRTNVIKNKKGDIWIVDFSVANHYPRIQELAVLACDILFDKNSQKKSEQNLRVALAEYQKTITLTQRELGVLPTYIKLAHAMHVLCATFQRNVMNNRTPENKYFLEIGRAGLRQRSGDGNAYNIFR